MGGSGNKDNTNNVLYGFVILMFIVIIYIIWEDKKENILVQPTYFQTMEDVYKYKIKDKKGLNYNDYMLEDQFLLNKSISIGDRIL